MLREADGRISVEKVVFEKLLGYVCILCFVHLPCGL